MNRSSRAHAKDPSTKDKAEPRAKTRLQARPKPARKPATIDDYLAGLSAAQRAALERVRRIIHATAPDAEECISYQIPAFKLRGKGLIWFAAAAHHCAIYGVSNDPALAGYDISGKGTLRFTAEQPLPEALIRKLVKSRMSKLAAKP